MVSSTFLVLVCSVLAVQAILDETSFSPEFTQLTQNIRGICIPKSGVDPATIVGVTKGVFVDEPKIKAYMRCLLAEIKAIDDRGVLDTNVIYNVLPDPVKEPGILNIRNCDAETKNITNVEDKVFHFFKCFSNAKPDTFIFF